MLDFVERPPLEQGDGALDDPPEVATGLQQGPLDRSIAFPLTPSHFRNFGSTKKMGRDNLPAPSHA